MNSETLILLLSGCSACLMLVVSLLLAMVGYILKQLVTTVRDLCQRTTIIETALKCDTNFAHKLSRAAGMFLLAALLYGCASPPGFLLSHTTDKQGVEHYEVSPAAKALTDGASVAGPWGTVGGLLAVGALTAWANWMNRRALQKHIDETKPS